MSRVTSLNIDKTKWIFVHPNHKKNLIPNEMPLLFIDNILLKKVTVTNFLGIYIDENLSLKSHIKNLSSKISKSIGILYKARCFLNKHTLLKLYYSLIHCHINYANIAWGSTNKSKLEPLYRQQKHVARLINFKDRFTHAKPLLIELKVLNIYELNIFNVICFMFKCKNNISPVPFHNLYNKKEKTKYILRNDNNICQSAYQTNFAKN